MVEIKTAEGFFSKRKNLKSEYSISFFFWAGFYRPFSMNSRAPTILMIEDDSQDLELTLMAMEEWVLLNKVLVVRNGEEAMDYFYRRGSFIDWPQGNPSFVLLDLKMPKVNGLDVLKAIKGNEHLQTIPVIVITSSRETVDLAECYENGANAYVVKPVDFGEFLWTVKQIGIFWSSINEPPLGPERMKIPLSCHPDFPSGKEEATHEIPA